MQFRCFQQAHVIRVIFMTHEIVDIPIGRRRTPGQVLRRHDDIESLTGAYQLATFLQLFCRIQESKPDPASR